MAHIIRIVNCMYLNIYPSVFSVFKRQKTKTELINEQSERGHCFYMYVLYILWYPWFVVLPYFFHLFAFTMYMFKVKNNFYREHRKICPLLIVSDTNSMVWFWYGNKHTHTNVRLQSHTYLKFRSAMYFDD